MMTIAIYDNVLPWFLSSQTETVNWSVKTHTLDEDEMEINEMIIQS